MVNITVPTPPSITTPVPSQVDSDQQPEEDEEDTEQTDHTIESTEDTITDSIGTVIDLNMLRAIMNQLTSLTQRMTVIENERTSTNNVSTPLRVTNPTINHTPDSAKRTTTSKVAIPSPASNKPKTIPSPVATKPKTVIVNGNRHRSNHQNSPDGDDDPDDDDNKNGHHDNNDDSNSGDDNGHRDSSINGGDRHRPPIAQMKHKKVMPTFNGDKTQGTNVSAYLTYKLDLENYMQLLRVGVKSTTRNDNP